MLPAWKWILIASFLIVGSSSTQADLIVNGGFENGTGVTPSAWTLTGNVSQYTGRTQSITPYDGSWSATFSNNPPSVSGLQQSINTTLGQDYLLAFHYMSNNSPSEVKATWNNTVLMDYLGQTSTWQYAQFLVTGTGTDIVSFSGYSAGYNGIDNVSLNAIPTGLVNGSFENGISGWNLLSGNPNLNFVAQNGQLPLPPTPDGNRYFAFGQNSSTASLDAWIGGLTPGNYYSLSYYVTSSTPNGINSLETRIDGGNVFSNMATQFSPGWASYTSTPFLVNSSSIELTFSGRSDLGYIGLDYVILNSLGNPSAVPEPSSVFLLGTGAVALFGFGWRRKQWKTALPSPVDVTGSSAQSAMSD